MNKKTATAIFTIILLYLAVASPTLAQEGLTTTIPPDDNTIVLQEWTWNGILFIGGVILVLFGGTIFAVYRSAPPWLQPILEAALQAGIRRVDTYVDTTENMIDNALWQEGIRRQFEEKGLIEPRFIEKDPLEPPPAFG